ncbi:hypothetical protein ACH4LN_19045 [Streptomyces albus]|uniref:hypothetical protein n=1 Tax=Streptomyces TaxID=1883 RepID=UPI0004CD12A1|nr:MULTISPECIES: hypothetical protein [Streptomyces]
MLSPLLCSRQGPATRARWARAQHIPGLYLQVSRTNHAARAPYARAGFTHAYSYHYRLRGPAGER